MAVTVIFTSVKPKKEPVKSVKGKYSLEAESGETIGTLISRFGLTPDRNISPLKNGIHADFQDPVTDGDTINYILIIVGG